MIPLVFIIALEWFPPEPITDIPWDYVTPIEIIDLGPTVEAMERQMQRQGECEE
jgi:hypothetical protein